MDPEHLKVVVERAGYLSRSVFNDGHSTQIEVRSQDVPIGFSACVTCTRKQRLIKIGAKFRVPGMMYGGQTEYLDNISNDRYRYRFSENHQEVHVRQVNYTPEADLDDCVKDLCKVSETIFAHLINSASQDVSSTYSFSEALYILQVSEDPIQLTDRKDTYENDRINVEGSEEEILDFRHSISSLLDPYFLWEIAPDRTVAGVRLNKFPIGQSAEALSQALEQWAMDLFDVGVAFEDFPFECVCFSYAANAYRFIPAPPHLQKFSLQHPLPDRNSYQVDLLRKAAFFAVVYQDSNVQLFEGNGIMSKIPPSERIALEDFENKDFNKCEVLGKGGFGYIYLNKYRKRENGEMVEVALKMIKTEKLVKQSNLEALVQEYRITQACNHANIIKVYGYTLFQESLVIVMEYCANKTLHKHVVDNQPSLKARMRLLVQLADGLLLMHSKSISHLDLKPQNILMSSDGNAKLADFGLSRLYCKGKAAGKIGYTLLYSSPEQIEGQDYGLESDIWSFGNLIYFVLFQKGPVDYLKGPSDNVHSFATKKMVLKELHENLRKPLIPDRFELRYPKLVHLMRSCWLLDQRLRPKATKVFRTLQKLLNSGVFPD